MYEGIAIGEWRRGSVRFVVMYVWGIRGEGDGSTVVSHYFV